MCPVCKVIIDHAAVKKRIANVSCIFDQKPCILKPVQKILRNPDCIAGGSHLLYVRFYSALLCLSQIGSQIFRPVIFHPADRLLTGKPLCRIGINHVRCLNTLKPDSILILQKHSLCKYQAAITKQIHVICHLAVKLAGDRTPEEMKDTLTEFYRDYGVGRFGLHKAFRVVRKKGGAQIVPIQNIAHVHLDDLVGYEIAKKKLIENTEAFVEGRKANNCLLFGDAGTGKSSSIKAIANEYYDAGLRIIEVYKHQFQDLNDVITQIKNRNYRFIIYMDDLSFEDFETEYKYLKAVIEGGLEKKPENVLIYATSNRRHIIREKFSDKEDRRDDLHSSDTVQEKLSLASRFGVTIFFASPDKKEFQNIVRVLAGRYGIAMPQEELLLEANKWELSHGGLSGRTAQQFIDYLLGKKE